MNQFRKHRSATQWQSILNDFQASGLSAPKFCEQNAISYASFAKWRHKLSASTRLGTNLNSGHLTAEPFLDLSTLPSSSTDKPWHITLKLGDGVELVLSQG